MNEKSMELLLWYQPREPTLLLLRSKTDSRVVQLGVHNWCQWQIVKIASLSIMCQYDHSLKDLYKLLPIAVIVMPLLGVVYISDCYLHVWYLWRSEYGVSSNGITITYCRESLFLGWELNLDSLLVPVQGLLPPLIITISTSWLIYNKMPIKDFKLNIIRHL